MFNHFNKNVILSSLWGEKEKKTYFGVLLIHFFHHSLHRKFMLVPLSEVGGGFIMQTGESLGWKRGPSSNGEEKAHCISDRTSLCRVPPTKSKLSSMREFTRRKKLTIIERRRNINQRFESRGRGEKFAFVRSFNAEKGENRKHIGKQSSRAGNSRKQH
jgi:hypothetical protein